jgi:pyruvate kinase
VFLKRAHYKGFVSVLTAESIEKRRTAVKCVVEKAGENPIGFIWLSISVAILKLCWVECEAAMTHFEMKPGEDVSLESLFVRLKALRARILGETQTELQSIDVQTNDDGRLFSLHNLLNYQVMRRENLHALQSGLAAAGLSSLGRVEPHVLSNIDAVLNVLSLAVDGAAYVPEKAEWCLGYEAGYHALQKRADRLFGVRPENRSEYILVTLPSEAADHPALAESLLAAGMNCARINCAHDNDQAWSKMVGHIRGQAKALGVTCPILMDLAGHKIRTGDIQVGQAASQKTREKFASGQKGQKGVYPKIHRHDKVLLCRDKARFSEMEAVFGLSVHAMVTVTCPDVIAMVSIGDSVWFDDGKMGGEVMDKRDEALLIDMTQVGPGGVRLKPEKGLNFPNTDLALPTLSDKDEHDLDFVCQHADMVGLSFTECAEDVLRLHNRMREKGVEPLPILAKIETAKAVRQLPTILAVSLARNIELGVMLARGDLAVELGSVRMAGVQDQILRVCEAAHIPVVWATQVMESFVKDGRISRPEITDAAMSQRAECVMLNKGPYITEAVRLLSDVLQKMESQQFKSHTHMDVLQL